MTELVVTVSWTQVGPILAFVVVTMFCIIGNVVKGFEVNLNFAGFGSPYLDLWAIGGCQDEVCARVKISDFDSATGGACDGAVRHLQAAAAFGIITSAVAGLSAIIALVFFLRNNITNPKMAGVILSFINIVLTLVAFILYITFKQAECFKEIDTTPHAGPFMYLGGFIFSLVAMALYAIQSAPRSSASAGSPRSLQHQEMDPRPQPEPRPTGRPAARPQYAETQQPAARTPSPPRAVASPYKQRVAVPPTASQAGSPGRVNTQDGELWPDGNDWTVDASSDLLWSEEKHLFFDRNSGQFFDPKSDQWYDPERNVWYKIQ